MPLCQSCANFDILSVWKQPDAALDLSLKLIARTASQCEFCSLLCEQFENQIADITDRNESLSGWRIWLQLHNVARGRKPKFTSFFASLSCNGLPYNGPSNDWDARPKGVQFRIAVSQGSPAARSDFLIGRYLGDDPKSPHHFSAIQQWLDDCLTHPKCCQNLSATRNITARHAPLPTRCIEWMGTNEFRLRETRNEFGSYITLSHRWAEETPAASTTTNNYEDRKAGNGWQGITKTFLDSIEVARRLDIKYVWIDSLCIIQGGDGGADWKEEANKMGSYYQNSIMTIAAIDSTKDDGFLSPRAQNSTFKRLVRLPYFDGAVKERGHIFVYKAEFDASERHRETHDRGLLTRGWVFQEWLLSRRIVYFTKHQLVFECQSKPPKNESNELIFGAKSSVFEKFWSVQKVDHALRLPGRNSTQHFKDWYFLIMKYCQLGLTKPDKDYVVAIQPCVISFWSWWPERENHTAPILTPRSIVLHNSLYK